MNLGAHIERGYPSFLHADSVCEGLAGIYDVFQTVVVANLSSQA
jgi:hypothetical protein